MKKHRYILIIILSLILLSATLYLLIQPSIGVPAVAVEQVAPKPDVSVLKGSLIERMLCTVSTILP